MLVTLFILMLSLKLFVMIDLKARPKQNDVANAIIIKVIFFIVCFFHKVNCFLFISCSQFEVRRSPVLESGSQIR